MAEEIKTPMSNQISTYKSFLDKLASLKNGAESQWVRSGHWPISSDEQGGIGRLLLKLSIDEKELLAAMLEDARVGGMHDMLAMIQESFDKQEMKISISGVDLPNSPFGSDLHYDFICRTHGDDWPDE